jgi:hypothetical protein
MKVRYDESGLHPHLADHIKYCVSPRGKSNSHGFLDWTRLRDDVTGNKIKADYYSAMYPVSLGGTSKNEDWYVYKPDPQWVEDILANRLVITDAVYENYLLPGLLLQIGKIADITDARGYHVIRYEYRNTFTLQGPYTPQQDNPVTYGEVYGLKNPYVNGFGPNYDYYRLVAQAWLGEAYTTPELLQYQMTFENNLDWRWYTRSSNNGRIRILDSFAPFPDHTTDGYHLVMDDAVNDTVFSLNEVWFHADLEKYKDIELSFWCKDYGEEAHAEDGVFFAEGATNRFVKVFSFPNQDDNRYTMIRLDVDSLATHFGLELTSEFAVKFQQYGRSSVYQGSSQSDGIAIDNISLTGTKGN